jgi:hypothetical protein
MDRESAKIAAPIFVGFLIFEAGRGEKSWSSSRSFSSSAADSFGKVLGKTY